MNTPNTLRGERTVPAAPCDVRWAQRWFAGDATCPVCGGDDLQITGTRTQSEGDTRVESWKCAASRCQGKWQVELRECAVAVRELRSDATRQWQERVSFERAPTFLLEFDDGVAQGVRLAVGSVMPRPTPRFMLREYESDGSLEGDRLSGVDARGLKYYEHELEVLDEPG
jgi:hypothetical protein